MLLSETKPAITKIEFNSNYQNIVGDTLTPVSIYLKIRDQFTNSILFESSDYHGGESDYSYICFEPISKFEVRDAQIFKRLPDQQTLVSPILKRTDVIDELKQYADTFTYKEPSSAFITHGIFGFTSYNAVRYFEDIDIPEFTDETRKIPDLLYQVYRYVIIYNHQNNEVIVYEHLIADEASKLNDVVALLKNKPFGSYNFLTHKDEQSNYTDEEFLQIIQKGKDHCHLGDVFQIVLSRRFSQSFEGDEFLVYRALRHINPSPYLFFFDFGGYRIFGSSPEAQLVIKNGQAAIFPIAGTFKRTGNNDLDRELANALFNDPKENSEHVMLVDLARNDLSRLASDVEVETFKEIQYYSHVVHLVSKVVGKIDNTDAVFKCVADTFPAGTLSGAPKFKAMQLISKYENGSRGYYGGAIGYIGFGGTFNHAIMIRTILSKGKKLYYQAGAGVVAESKTENELQEVNNKLMALRKAIDLAETL